MSATGPALQAALKVAAAHGLRVEHPVVLHDQWNLVVHLAPAPVVVRVATLTAVSRGSQLRAFLEREVAVLTHLARLGAPAMPLAAELPPGPHKQDGYLMTFWAWVDHDARRPIDAGSIGHTLRDLHDAMRLFPAPPPTPFDALAEACHILDRLEATGVYTADELAPMRRASDRLRAAQEAMASAPLQLIHGDSHRANLLRTPSGVLWADFEETRLGPREWDLACLLAGSRTWGPPVPEVEAALDAYGPHDPDLLAAMVELRAYVVAAWALEIGPRSAETREQAAVRLGWWRDRER